MTTLTVPHLCEKHRPPAGVRQAEVWRAIGMAVTANFMHRPEIIRECGGDVDLQIPAKGKLIRSAIMRHAPICCFIDQAEMDRISLRYARPGFWRRVLLALAGYDWSELQKWRAGDQAARSLLLEAYNNTKVGPVKWRVPVEHGESWEQWCRAVKEVLL